MPLNPFPDEAVETALDILTCHCMWYEGGSMLVKRGSSRLRKYTMPGARWL